MAQRSVACTLKNESKHDLVLDRVELDHGIWSAAGQPPARVARGAEGRWESESNGVMTGTEGTAVYRVGDTGALLTIYWDNPFVGDNTFTQILFPPAQGAGPGVPDYVAFDPMRPSSVKTPTEPSDFASGSNIAITYRFQQAEPLDEQISAATPTAQPDADAPRVAAAPPAKPTTVRDPSPPRRLIYIGFTTTSAHHEDKSLAKHMGASSLISITSSNHAWVEQDKDFEARTPLIPKERRDKLKALEEATDLVEWTEAGLHLKLDRKLRIFALRALAATFARCDEDLDPNADVSFAKRLCISAHYSPPMTGDRRDVMWGAPGHAVPHRLITFFSEGGNQGVLQGLAEIFPKAFAHVEDLMLSACNTGQEDLELAGKLFGLFKNLKTIWAYEGSSPGPADSNKPLPAYVHSSTRGICEWEVASREAGAKDAIQKACRDLRSKGGGPSVTWIEGKYSK